MLSEKSFGIISASVCQLLLKIKRESVFSKNVAPGQEATLTSGRAESQEDLGSTNWS